jgi:glycosyltransferase involved in cell wall biosynthesis
VSAAVAPGLDPLLFFGVVPLASMPQRPHHFATALARRFEVVYVDPHRSIGRIALEHARPAAGDAGAELPAGIHRLEARPVLPWSGYLPPVNAFNYARVAGRVRTFFAAQGLGAPRALVATFPKHVDALRHFPGVPVIYDVMDDYSGFFDRWQARVIERLHQRLLRAATLVTVSSRVLEQRSRRHARALQWIGNGVEDAFVQACDHATPDPEIAALPAPRLGYLGTLGDWVDLGTVRALAAAFPHGTVVLVGPVQTRLATLPRNVQVVGMLPRRRLPGVLAAFDVGLVPFRRSRLTDAVNPIKIYEYFAAGLPVIAADLEELRSWRGALACCASEAEWIAATRGALASAPDPGLREARRGIAAGRRWADLAAAFVNAVEQQVAA